MLLVNTASLFSRPRRVRTKCLCFLYSYYDDPYSDDGLLGGWDFPQLPVAHSKGAANNEIELRLHFREFTRLEIEGTWFRISDYYLWRIHLKLRKTNGKWVNNGTTKALDNNGF